jgi:hypothetical protein
MLGVSLHYGPDYKSEASGVGRMPSFFAMGPIIGGYAGLNFKRSNGDQSRFQLGFSPYIIPLFGINIRKITGVLSPEVFLMDLLVLVSG